MSAPWGSQGGNSSARPPFSLAQVPGWVWLVVLYAGIWLLERAGRISEFSAIYFSVFFPSVIFHEVSHGMVANAFGDDTAKRAGRLTANPLKHVDPIGTIILPIVSLLTAGFAFGYAKPVPVNLDKLRNRHQQALLVSLAGPASNLVLVAASYLVLQFTKGDAFSAPWWWLGVFYLGYANLWIAIFNMIPIPPFDGAAILEWFLPERYWPTYLKLRPWSMLVVILLVTVGRGPLTALGNDVGNFWFNLVS